MRIIGGRYKGRVIKLPKGIRPTQDKVRKALFDILADIEGLSFLELFAGSGAIGFEALSRGAADLTLVEYNRDCLSAIKKNIESLALKAPALYPQEVQGAIKVLHKEEKKFDIIFLDPPYPKTLVPRPYDKSNKRGSGSTGNLQEQPLSKKTLQILGAYDILAPNGFVVVQHFKKDGLPQESGELRLVKESRYGDTILSFYRKVNPKSQ
jgi:16S rRNA (guanine(966)-N(2))-methyltransferase RsmD